MEEPSDPPRLTYLVARLERGIRTRLDAIVREHGLTTPQYTTLSVLARRSGLSSAQLARRAFVSPQAMNLIVTQLAERHLVRRSRSAEHARILCSELTDEGRRVLEACDRGVDGLEEQLAGGISSTQLNVLRTGLAACADRLVTARP